MVHLIRAGGLEDLVQTTCQTDYATINRRFRNIFTIIRTFPGADFGGDLMPVVVDMRITIKKLKQISPKNDLKVLK